MMRFTRAVAAILVLVGAAPAPSATGPLRVLASNPRYFTDGSGKAIFLTGSRVWENLQDEGPTSSPPAQPNLCTREAHLISFRM
jgi:hypothetical protein